MSETTRALLLRQHGGLENLQLVSDYPRPKAKPGSVVIRVRASLPVLVLIGVPYGMEVEGRAPVESFGDD